MMKNYKICILSLLLKLIIIKYKNLYSNRLQRNVIFCTATKNCLKSCKRPIWNASIFILHHVTFYQISNECCNLIKCRTMKVICEQANFFLKKFSTQYGIHNLYINNIPQGDVYLLQLLEIVLHPSFVELLVDNRKYFLTYYCSRTFLCVLSNGSSEKKIL